MKNVLHFSQRVNVKAEKIGKPVDSGNGYSSYYYYLLPYSGKMTQEGLAAVSTILHKRHYRAPFTSMNGVELFGENDSDGGGLILYSVTYHHGD